MRELLDKVESKFNEINAIIGSQKELIKAREKEIIELKKELAHKDGQLIEVNNKWNNMRKLLKGAEI